MLAAVSQFNLRAEAVTLRTPGPEGTVFATAPPDAGVLPLNSRLTFILDGTISSATSHSDEMVNAHLKDSLTLKGRTVAPAGTPVQIRVLDAKPATNPDIYGFVDIYFEPLHLADGRTLALHAPISHLNVNSSAGHESTVGIENTVGDIFTPTLLLHVLRKGRNFTLGPGAEIHALTEAALELLPNGTIAITTPAPIAVEEATPHSAFRSIPLATPNPSFHPELTPKPLDKSTPPA